MFRDIAHYTVLLFAGLLLVLTACDGGGSGRSRPVGPDLKGRWSGIYFIDGVANSTEEITARISHDGDAVVIVTSRDGQLGGRLTGTIDEGGGLFMTDPVDGETWTTFFGPATENFLQVADLRRDLSESAIAVIRLER